MKRAHGIVPQITEEEPTVNQFLTLDAFSPHVALSPGELREIINMDLFGSYMKTRRGSELFINQLAPDYDILNYVIFDSGDVEYLVIQVSDGDGNYSSYHSIALVPEGVWTDVVDRYTGEPILLGGGTEITADMLVSNGKIYIFQDGGNRIFELDGIEFRSRKMGLPAPQIAAPFSYDIAPQVGALKGKRVYGVELAYKDTSVNPNVDIVVSGPNRAKEVVGVPEFGEGQLVVVEGDGITTQIWVSRTLNDGSDIWAIENSFWSHIRLWRSKDVTTATNSTPDLEGPAEIIGRFDELYLVLEMTKADFEGTWDVDDEVFKLPYDAILDDAMPFPLDVVTGDRLELYPIPPATTGAFQRNRIWASGISSFPGPSGPVILKNIQSKIFYSPETYTKYSENVQALSAIESEPGDGERMVKILPFLEDLVGIKEGKTGRVPRGDPNAGWVTEDHVIGISSKRFAQYVPNVGICAIVNDQKDFRIFGYNLAWQSTFAGLQISRPIRDIIKPWVPEDVSFMYMNGKLFLNGGAGEVLVLNVEQQKGWARYRYPLFDESSEARSEVMFTFDEGRKAAIVSSGLPVVRIEVDDLETDYNPKEQIIQYVDWLFTTHKWQFLEGRALVEFRWLSLVAIFREQIQVQPYVNGRVWGDPFGMLIDPADYPYSELQETEYQGYCEIKPIANFLHFDISGNKPASIYSMMLNCLVQRANIAPGFDPFDVLSLATRVPPWASTAGDYDEVGDAEININETGAQVTEILEEP